MASSFVVPAGSMRETTPEKMTSVALPMIFGATTARTTQTTLKRPMTASAALCLPSRPMRRLAEGQKFFAVRGAEPDHSSPAVAASSSWSSCSESS